MTTLDEHLTPLRPVFAGSGTDSMFLFFTGGLDLAYVGLTPFLLGRSYGLPVRIVSVAQRFKTSHGVVLRKRRPSSARAGPFRLGTVMGSTGHFIGHQWAEAHGEDVQFINLSPKDQSKALSFGFIDGAAVWEPHLTVMAGQDGVGRVFSAEDGTVPCFNVLCATETALSERLEEVQRFVAVNDDATDVLMASDNDAYLTYLDAVFDHRLSPEEHGHILRSRYDWSEVGWLTAASAPPDLQDALDASARFLAEAGLLSKGWSDEGSYFVDDQVTSPQAARSRTAHAPLAVGYSDSLMCSTYFVAQGAGILTQHGFEAIRDERRLVERVARLGGEAQENLRRVKGLLEDDPTLAAIKAGRMIEQLFGRVHSVCFGEAPPNRLSTTLQKLSDQEVAPQVVLTAAHFVRSVRNVASHRSEIARPQAERTYLHLVDILEWYHDNADALAKRCPRCARSLEDNWSVCPFCTLPLAPSCSNCGQDLERGWQACPACGEEVA